jgi:hypothetical protein
MLPTGLRPTKALDYCLDPDNSSLTQVANPHSTKSNQWRPRSLSGESKPEHFSTLVEKNRPLETYDMARQKISKLQVSCRDPS